MMLNRAEYVCLVRLVRLVRLVIFFTTNQLLMSANADKVVGGMADELGDRMKGYEAVYGQLRVSNDHVMLIRLDGVSFSTWTRGLDAVFDLIFTRSMILTMNDLLVKFRPQTAYTHSDEITLIFAPLPRTNNKSTLKNDEKKNDEKNDKQKDTDADACWEPHIYKGRVQKVVSVMASYATIRFNFHFAEQMRAHPSGEGRYTKQASGSNPAIFDARVLSFPPNLQYEVANHMMWRSVFDCHRNCVSAFMRAFISSKKLHGIDCKTMIQRMRDHHNFNFDNVPFYLKYGTFAKIQSTPTTPTNPTTPTDQKTIIDAAVSTREQQKAKSVVENRCGRVYCSPEWVETLLAKTWLPDKLPLTEPSLVVPPFHANQIQLLQSTATKPSTLTNRDLTIRLTLVHPPTKKPASTAKEVSGTAIHNG